MVAALCESAAASRRTVGGVFITTSGRASADGPISGPPTVSQLLAEAP